MQPIERQPPPGGFDQPCEISILHRVLRDPPTDDEISVPGERILYKRRKHWLSLAASVRRRAALLFVGLQLVLGLATMGPVAAVLFAASLYELWRWVSRHSTAKVIALALPVVLVGLATPGLTAAWAVLVVQVFLGLVAAIIEYRCYAFLYLTNRRLIATRGIIQRDVSTMPIARITDVRLRLTWFGETIGELPFGWAEPYGEFSVESAGQNQALGKLKYLLDAQWFSETVLLLATSAKSIEDDGT